MQASALYGNWEQDLLLRPNFVTNRLWIELAGNPRFTTTVALTPAGNNEFDWAWSGLGLSMSGWIKKVGNPAGSKLKMHIDEGEYQEFTWTNVTLPDLNKVP